MEELFTKVTLAGLLSSLHAYLLHRTSAAAVVCPEGSTRLHLCIWPVATSECQLVLQGIVEPLLCAGWPALKFATGS